MLVCVQLIITTVMWLQFHYCDTIHKTRSKPKHGPFTRCTWFSRPCVSHGRCQLTDSTPSGWLIKHPKLLLAVDDGSAQPLASVQYRFMLGCLDVAFYTKWFISGNVLFSTHANEVMFLLTDQIQPHCVYWNVTVTVKGDISFVVSWRRVYQCQHIGIVDFLYTYGIVVFVKHMVCVSDRKLPIIVCARPV